MQMSLPEPIQSFPGNVSKSVIKHPSLSTLQYDMQNALPFPELACGILATNTRSYAKHTEQMEN